MTVRQETGRVSENLGCLFRQHTESERLFAIDLSGPSPRTISYCELDSWCNAVAHLLVRRGLAAGDRIAILSLNSAPYIAVLFGALRAGCVPVPINVKLPVATVRDILRDGAVRLAFAEPAFHDLVGEEIEIVPLADWPQSLPQGGAFDAVEPAPRQVSMQPYTAGTTGRPKGVLLTHAGQAWAARILAEHRRVLPDERMLLSAPLFHKNAIVATKTALHVGSCLVILPRFDAAASLDAILDHRCTTLTGVPTMMHLLLAEMETRHHKAITSIHTISIGSAPASPDLLKTLSVAFPEASIHLNYGVTEAGPISFGWFHPDGKPRPVESIGYPLPGCELRLSDGSDEHRGELWVRNPGVAVGYHNLPDETARKFVDGWYRTGDVLRRDADGWYYFLGRVDDMFVCGGENLYPQELETALERHPDVDQAAVLPFPHATKGEVPYAFIVRRPGSEIDEAAVKDFALKNGPAYAHPRRVFFVDAFPLTGANKIDRAALRALHQSDASSEENMHA